MNEEEASRLLRDHDNLGADSSLWLRVTRQLREEGKPLGETVLVVLKMPGHGDRPLGAFTLTKKNRLIFWPVLPARPRLFSSWSGRPTTVTDHVTLELPSRRSHVTAYDSSGTRDSLPRSWKLHHFKDAGPALWFLLLARTTILSEQDAVVQRRVSVPPRDKERRVSEVKEFCKHFRRARPVMPRADAEPDSVCCAFYVVRGDVTEAECQGLLFRPREWFGDAISGWPVDQTVQPAASKFTVGSQTLLIVLGFPPGIAESEVLIGFPTTESKS